jgi:chromosome segregation ATPase
MKFLLFSAANAAVLTANPIRRVVNMLQAMQKKCEEEGRKEEDLYEKFVCYCKTNSGELTQSIADAQTKISQLETQVTEDTAAKAQLDEELKNHKSDRAEAQQALAGATKIREKDAATYAKNESDLSTNIRALGKAVDALEKGLSGGAFMQGGSMSREGVTLRKLATTANLSDIDRESITAFLSNSATAPGTSEIVGILKEMKDEMERDHKDLVAAEDAAIAQFAN